MRALLLLGALSVTGCWGERPPRKEKLTLYCSAQVELCEATARAFAIQSGVEVRMTRKGAGETLAQLLAERRNPRADVWWGGTSDAHLQAAESGLLAVYRSAGLAALHPWARELAEQAGFRTSGVYLGALAIAYNREWLEKKGLPPPVGWKALLEPAFRGEVQMANPNSSGTAYTILASLVALFGDGQGFAFLRALDRNIGQYTLSGAAPARAVARGEAGVAIVFLHDAITEARAGHPVEALTPPEGTGYEVGCVSLVRGARHLGPAQRFIDWALSLEGQGVGLEANSYQWPAHPSAPVSPAAPPLDGVKLLPLDLVKFGTKQERTRLLSRWEAEVRGGRAP